MAGPFPQPPVQGAPGSLANWSALNNLEYRFRGYSPGSFAPVGSVGGGGSSDALLATVDYGAVGDGVTHTDGTKIQAFLNGALTTGRIHRIPKGTYLLESSNGVPVNLVLDLASAVFDTTVIQWDPGAILKVPSNIGLAPTYFTGVSRSASNVTLTGVPTGHGLTAGMHIEVYGPTWDYDNGDFVVTSAATNTVTYAQGNTHGTTPDTTHGGWIKAYVSCFSVINGNSGAGAELWRPQFLGPGAGSIDPNATPTSLVAGCGPLFGSRVETHGLISTNFYAGILVDGAGGVNTDHFHHYDIKNVSSNYIGIMFRANIAATRDYRIDTAAIGPCQRAGIECSLNGVLPDVSAKDVHFNATPSAIRKQGFRGVALAAGSGGSLFDGVSMSRCKAEGSGNFAIEGGEAVIEKWTGNFELHGLEINAGGGTNHTLRDIDLTALTRSTTVVSATYSRTSAGTTTSGSCVVTGLTASAFTWRDIGCQIVKADLPAGTWIVAVVSTTSVVVSNAATGSSTSTCYSKPILLVGDHLAIFSNDAGATLNRPAVVKTLAGAGPFTLTAETVGDTGTIASTTATAGVIGGIRGGTLQHSHVEFSTQSDATTAPTASEGYWDLADLDVNEFTQLRNPNAQAGYSAFPSVNLRAGSVTGSLRTMFRHGNQKVQLVKVTAAVPAGSCTEIGGAGNRKVSTVAKAHLAGGYALQPGDATTAHATGATQTTRLNVWVARDGDYRSTSGGQGVLVTGTPASGDVLVEDSGTPGSVKTWDGTTAGLRIIGTATSAAASGVCGVEVTPGESWTT